MRNAGYNDVKNRLQCRNLWKLFVTSILLITAIGFNPVRSAAQSCAETAGKVERSTYLSEIVQSTMYYSVYTPPCYDQLQTSYPVVYLMHGSNEDDGEWTRL